MARTRFENGVATEVDVLRSEVAVANGQPEIVQAENAIRQGRSMLNYYLVRPIDFPTKVAGTFEEQSWEEWGLEELMPGTPNGVVRKLVRLRIAERSAETQLELAKAESRMSVDFNGAYGIASARTANLVDGQFRRWSMGLSFTLPVFDGFRRSGLVWQAVANQRSARLEREKTEQQVRLGLQQGLDAIRTAQETITAARANIEQAEKVLEMTQSNYKYGAATTLDIVDAQTALSQARTNLLLGLHDYSVGAREPAVDRGEGAVGVSTGERMKRQSRNCKASLMLVAPFALDPGRVPASGRSRAAGGGGSARPGECPQCPA